MIITDNVCSKIQNVALSLINLNLNLNLNSYPNPNPHPIRLIITAIVMRRRQKNHTITLSLGKTYWMVTIPIVLVFECLDHHPIPREHDSDLKTQISDCEDSERFGGVRARLGGV